MTHLRFTLIVIVTSALVLGAGARAATPSLYANYNTNCVFSFVGDNGATVTTVPPGQYQVVVTTPTAFGNGDAACAYVQFQLSGPGVNVATTLSFGDAENEQFTVTLQPSSTYTVVDSGRPALTQRSLNVLATGTASSGGSSGSSTTSSGTSTAKSGGGSSSGGLSPIGTPLKSVPFRGTLIGTVTARGALTLTSKGKAVTQLKAGRYTIAVTDHSAKAGFTVQEIRKAGTTLTGVGAVGKRSVTVNLTRGQWFFYPTFVGKKTYFIIVA
jgi:hypothetical protein